MVSATTTWGVILPHGFSMRRAFAAQSMARWNDADLLRAAWDILTKGNANDSDATIRSVFGADEGATVSMFVG